jgi:protein transport protein SEC13
MSTGLVTSLTSFDSGHEELIHDAQLDYYGKRLATASSDKTIRIFELQGDKQNLLALIKGHDGPVWSLSWAHPKWGCILASASYDGRIIIWKELQQGQFNKIFEFFRADTSINSVQFAPHTFGLQLAAALSDGSIAVFTRRNDNNSANQWSEQIFFGHKGGCNAISWGPDMKTGAILANAQQLSQQNPQQNKFEKQFVSGGCDGKVKIWKLDENSGQWGELAQQLLPDENYHTDWVRDVAWAPSIGLPSNIIASASEDKTVIIWQEAIESGAWKKSKVLQFPNKVWRVSWSLQGQILAVSEGDNSVSLWKESLDGDWKPLANMQQNNSQQQPIIQPQAQQDGKLDF